MAPGSEVTCMEAWQRMVRPCRKKSGMLAFHGFSGLQEPMVYHDFTSVWALPHWFNMFNHV